MYFFCLHKRFPKSVISSAWLQNVNDLEESYGSATQGVLYAFYMDVTDDKSVRNSRKIVDRVLQEKNLGLHPCMNDFFCNKHFSLIFLVVLIEWTFL